MPIPLIAALVGGLGLSAGKTVFAGRRQQKQRGLFDEALGNAERLDEGQRNLARSIFSVNQQEGLDLLDNMLQRNLQREQLRQAAAFQVENVHDRRENLALRQREADQKRRELDQATDPKVTAAAAARKGLRVIGTPEEIAAGNFEVAPIKRSTEWHEGVAGFRSVADSLENANILFESIARHGAVIDLSNPAAQEQALAYQRMIAGMKTVLETGALAEFEAEMVGRAIQDPASVFNAFMGGGDAKALASAAGFRNMIQKSGSRQLRDKRNYQLDQQDVDFMGRQMQRSIQPAQPRILPDPAAPPASDAGQLAAELALRAQIVNANLSGNVRQSADLMTRLRQLQQQGEDIGAGRAVLPGEIGGTVQGAGRTIFDLIKAF